MKLPNRENAYIHPAKLTGYLLSKTHSVGKSKAKFFLDLGFNESNVPLLKQEFLNIALSQDITETIPSVHGIKYVIIGTINTPVCRTVSILTVWIIDEGEETPRFVTARPFLNS